MKIIALLGSTRAGVHLFQSLLDNHSEVSQLPGYFPFNKFWQTIEKESDSEIVVEKFIDDYEFFFDSRLNFLNRHYMLGDDKKGFYIVDKEKFKKSYIFLSKNKEKNMLNVLNNIHLAYSLSKGEDIKNKKIIILNIHNISNLKSLDVINFEVFYMIRNPLNSISSATKGWLKYKDGKELTPWSFYFNIERVFNGLKTLLELKYKIHVVKLEELHKNNKKVMNSAIKILNINYEPSLAVSTYHGKLWWGDQVSSSHINGINPNFNEEINYNYFYKKDVKCLERYLENFMVKYDYKFNEKKLVFNFVKFLPMRTELKVWKKIIFSMNIKSILLIFYYWLKRINLMNDNNYKNVSFPDHIGYK